MTIYRFKVINSIGNVFTIGKMAASRQVVEDYCKEKIAEANKNSKCNWEYRIEQVK